MPTSPGPASTSDRGAAARSSSSVATPVHAGAVSAPTATATEPATTSTAAASEPAPAPPNLSSPTGQAATNRPPTTPVAPAAPARMPVPSPRPVAGTAVVHTIRLTGRIQLSENGDLRPQPGDHRQTVVYYVPEQGGMRPKPGRYSIYTQGKAFDPPYLVVPVGSTISFPNNDPIRHNVYSPTPGAAFDLGFYGEGDSRERVFDRPGLVLLNCNVHRAMQAEVLVLPTVHHARTDDEGHFHLEGLPAGRGTLHYWHPRAGLQSLPLSLPSGQPVERRLVLTRARAVRTP